MTSSKPVRFLRLEVPIAELELLAESVVGFAMGVADEKPLQSPFPGSWRQHASSSMWGGAL